MWLYAAGRLLMWNVCEGGIWFYWQQLNIKQEANSKVEMATDILVNENSVSVKNRNQRECYVALME